jgi:hypothetical protein
MAARVVIRRDEFGVAITGCNACATEDKINEDDDDNSCVTDGFAVDGFKGVDTTPESALESALDICGGGVIIGGSHCDWPVDALAKYILPLDVSVYALHPGGIGGIIEV